MAHEVLHILATAQPEGSSIARMVSALARGVDPERYRLHAWFLAGEGPLVGPLKQAGARTDALDWARGARDPAGGWKFWRRLHGSSIDIVHIHCGGRSVRWLARVAPGAKIVVHLHGRILEPRGLSRIGFSARDADVVVAVSHAVASRVVDDSARVIYAGTDVPPVDSLAPRRRSTSEGILGTAGRLIPLKGVEFLLSAAATLPDEFPQRPIHFALVTTICCGPGLRLRSCTIAEPVRRKRPLPDGQSATGRAISSGLSE